MDDLIKGQCVVCKKEFWMTEEMAEAIIEKARREVCIMCETTEDR